MEIYKIEKDYKDLLAIVYDEPINNDPNYKKIRIKVCFERNNHESFNKALKKFWDEFNRMVTNKNIQGY